MLLILDTNRTLYNLYSNVCLRGELKVKELGPDQPDGLIYCEELFVKSFAVPQPHLKTFHQPPLPMMLIGLYQLNAFLTATLMLFISSVFYHSRLTCTL